MKRTLAIIPARGNSKRIPHKNIRFFLGKPIIFYPIKAALESKLFAEVMVSTDDKEIVNLSKRYGATVPFLRSKKNSGGQATIADVIEEILIVYRNKGICFDHACCLLPTAPFITPNLLAKGYRLLLKEKIDSVIPVVRYSYPIERAFRIKEDRLKMIQPKNINTNSQHLGSTYHDAGQFYWIKTESFLKQKKIFTNNCFPLIISELEAHDIDTEEDWKIAETKFNMLRQTKSEKLGKIII